MKSKYKNKEIMMVGAIASKYGGKTHVIIPNFFLGKRVVVVLKDRWEEIDRLEQRNNNAQVATFVNALVSQRK